MRELPVFQNAGINHDQTLKQGIITPWVRAVRGRPEGALRDVFQLFRKHGRY